MGGGEGLGIGRWGGVVTGDRSVGGGGETGDRRWGGGGL